MTLSPNIYLGLIVIEPWIGHSDYIGFAGEFKEKESMIELFVEMKIDCLFIN